MEELSRPQGVPDVGTLLLGKYRVEDVLGIGGMGAVVAARHEHLDERVALKLLHATLAGDPEVRARFKREGPAAFKLRSEHVCRVFDAGELDDGTPFIAMELLEGETLSRVLESRPRLPLGEAIDIALQACEGLIDAHAHGVVHRDFKPSNLVLTRRRDGSLCAKVIDFGISKMELAGLEMTHTFGFLGSPSYAAPEQLTSAKAVTKQADIWSLGIVLYTMLMGEHPFRVAGETFAVITTMIMHDDPRPMTARDPSIPPAVEAAVFRCLEKDPARRWGDLRELVAALAPFASRPRDRYFSESEHPTTPRIPENELPPGDDTTTANRVRPAAGRPLRESTTPTVLTGDSGAVAFAGPASEPDLPRFGARPALDSRRMITGPQAPSDLPPLDSWRMITGPQSPRDLPRPALDSRRMLTGPQAPGDLPARDSLRLVTGPQVPPPSVTAALPPRPAAPSLSDTRWAPAQAPVRAAPPTAAPAPSASRGLAWAIAALVGALTLMLVLKIVFGHRPPPPPPAPADTAPVPYVGAVAPGPVSTGVTIEPSASPEAVVAPPPAPIAPGAAPSASAAAPPSTAGRGTGRAAAPPHAPRHAPSSEGGPKILKDWKGNF